MKIDKRYFGLSLIVVGSFFKIQRFYWGNFLVSILILGIILTGCIRTEGTIKIIGKVVDENTKVPIPGRAIIIHGLLVNSENKLVQTYAGQFSTDSSGCFTYSLKKIKNAYSYNFFLVGDSNYVSKTKEISLFSLKNNAKYLFFSINKLVDLTIKINRISKTPVGTTLIMSLKSDGIDGRLLYPYIIENYGIDGSILDPYKFDYGLRSNLNSIWIGENVKSIIKTRVLADRRTTVRWVLYKTMKLRERIDTITCRRDMVNEIYFKY